MTVNRPYRKALLDVDNMKEININSGHQCGDDALKYVARHVQMSIREGDVAILYGGDELLFSLLISTYNMGMQGSCCIDTKIRR